MKVQTRYFGEVDIQEEKIITFEEGIPGFEALRQFAYIDMKEGLFHYLQSIEEKSICFVVVDPYEIAEDYAPIINESYFEKLGGGENEQFLILTIACIKQPLETTTINLKGPLLIHTDTKKGIQVIMDDKKYKTKHELKDYLK